MEDYTAYVQQVVAKHCSHLTNDYEREVIAAAIRAAMEEISAFINSEWRVKDVRDKMYGISSDAGRQEGFRLYAPKVKKNRRYKGMKGT